MVQKIKKVIPHRTDDAPRAAFARVQLALLQELFLPYCSLHTALMSQFFGCVHIFGDCNSRAD
jgi:hypothetical protein